MKPFDPTPPNEAADAERAAKRSEALAAAKEAAKRGDWEYVRREAAAMPAPAPDAHGLAARIDEAPDLEALAALAPPPEPEPLPTVDLVTAAEQPLPPPVIRRRGHRGAVLVRGEVSTLTGAGKSGKSTVALQLAMAGALADAAGAKWGTACGLDVAAGGALIASWEDRGSIVGIRSRHVADAAAKHGVYVLGVFEGPRRYRKATNVEVLAARQAVRIIDMRAHGPLFAPPPNDHGQALTNALPRETDAFGRLWRAVPEGGLLIVDPAGDAFEGEPNAVVQVRAFLQALAVAAEDRDAAVLLVHHAPKSGRGKNAADPSNVAAGSMAWTDKARGVLTLRDDDGGTAELKCTAANYGPAWWREHLDRPNSDRPVLRWLPDGPGKGNGEQSGAVGKANGRTAGMTDREGIL